jgi:hypothetical protein
MLDAILTTLGNIPYSFLAIAGKLMPLGKGTNMVAVSIAAILAGAFAMDKQPSFARCKLHLACITRNPSRFAFYFRGIVREFKEATPFALVFAAGCSPFFGLCLVKLFSQH